MFCHMAYHMAYQIIPYMDPIFKPWIVAHFLTLISGLKSSTRGNNGFIMWYKYYSRTIALRLSSSPPIHRGYLSVCSQGPFLWIRLLIKGAHVWVFTYKFPELFSPLWLCYWSTDPSCLASSICHFAPNCPLSRTNRPNKTWCPAITKREKWESVKMLPCRDAAKKKKKQREKRSHNCKWSEKKVAARCQRSIDTSSITDWRKNEKGFEVLAGKKSVLSWVWKSLPRFFF